MDKSKALYDSENQSIRAKGFQDVATGRFRSGLENENQVREFLSQN